MYRLLLVHIPGTSKKLQTVLYVFITVFSDCQGYFIKE
jgi:hypothetical protein